ncbi:MAG: MFS transporter [Chloroflexota bacterium]
MTDVPAAHDPGVRDLLRIPAFRRLYVAQAISDLGDGMTFLALYLLVLNLTQSTAAVAVVSILVALPPVTIGLVAGAVADRMDRRLLMVGSDLVRAVLVAAMVPAALAGSVPVIFTLACLQAVIGTFFTPARMAMLPRAVPLEGLLAANSIGQATRMVMGVVGAGVTGVVAAVAGFAWPVLLVDAATFLASALIVVGLARELGMPSGVHAGGVQGLGGSVVEGLRVVARSRPLVATLGGVAMTMLGIGAINVLFLPFVVRDLGASPAWAGLLEGAQTLSMILAGTMVTALAARLRTSTLFTVSLAGVAVCVSLFAAAPGPWAVALIMFAVGWFVMPVQVTTATIVQTATTDATRGRVAGALNAVVQTATIGSMAAAGILAGVVGIRAVFVGGAAVVGLAAVVAWWLFRDAGASVLQQTGTGTMPDPEAPAGAVVTAGAEPAS